MTTQWASRSTTFSCPRILGFTNLLWAWCRQTLPRIPRPVIWVLASWCNKCREDIVLRAIAIEQVVLQPMIKKLQWAIITFTLICLQRYPNNSQSQVREFYWNQWHRQELVIRSRLNLRSSRQWTSAWSLTKPDLGESIFPISWELLKWAGSKSTMLIWRSTRARRMTRWIMQAWLRWSCRKQMDKTNEERNEKYTK